MSAKREGGLGQIMKFGDLKVGFQTTTETEEQITIALSCMEILGGTTDVIGIKTLFVSTTKIIE